MRARSRTFACCGALGLEALEASANQAFQIPRERRRPGVARRIPWDCDPLFPSYFTSRLVNALGTDSPNAKTPSEHRADNARPCSGLCVLAHRAVDNLMKRVLPPQLQVLRICGCWLALEKLA